MGYVTLRTWRQRSAATAARAATLKARLAAALDLGPQDALSVTEVACADPACAGLETVVLVLRAGEPSRAIRLACALDAVDDEAIWAACEGERLQRRR
ncbi:hypothetical protein [Methylobacterium oryzisoli]|uniref:hypothetical protein n=1 Tax=Methylobacterium oryzisoli TaxID=3385502 RepID=UPI0038911A3F